MSAMLPDQIVAEIHSQVRHGYYPREVVVGSVLHFFGAELGVDEGVQRLDDVPEALVASVRDAVDRAFRELEAEAASWPSPTDCQRIRAAFDALEREGIITVENCGVDLDDGIHVIANADLDREEAGAAPSTGFCFFHQQDVMSAMDGAGLTLAYGTFEDDDAERTRADKTQEIGRRVAAACTGQGLEVQWNGSPDARISLPRFRWQLAPPTE